MFWTYQGLKKLVWVSYGGGGVVVAHVLYPAVLVYLNFQPLEVVSRYRDPQPTVAENYSYLFNLRPNFYKS